MQQFLGAGVLYTIPFQDPDQAPGHPLHSPWVTSPLQLCRAASPPIRTKSPGVSAAAEVIDTWSLALIHISSLGNSEA